MPRELTAEQARAMAANRKHNRGGRPRKETPCPKCGKACKSARKALAHC